VYSQDGRSQDGPTYLPSDGRCCSHSEEEASADNSCGDCSGHGSNHSSDSSAHNTYNSYTIRASCSYSTHSALTTYGDVVHQCSTTNSHKEAGDDPCSSTYRSKRSKRSTSDRQQRCSSHSEQHRSLRYPARSCVYALPKYCTSRHRHRCHTQGANPYNDTACASASNDRMNSRCMLRFRNSQRGRSC